MTRKKWCILSLVATFAMLCAVASLTYRIATDAGIGAQARAAASICFCFVGALCALIEARKTP